MVLASVNVMQSPSQIEVDDALITGIGPAQVFTVTVTCAVSVQPFASVTKTVYVVVLVGLAVTFAPLEELRLEEGAQE